MFYNNSFFLRTPGRRIPVYVEGGLRVLVHYVELLHQIILYFYKTVAHHTHVVFCMYNIHLCILETVVSFQVLERFR